MFVRRLVHTGLFLLGLLGTAAWLRHVDEVPIWSWSRARYLQLRDEIDRYDTVFIGSSRVCFAVVPELFDRSMAELGFRTDSLNFAMSGLRGHECNESIEWLLDQRPTRIKTMVIELNTFDQGRRGPNWLTDQDVEMHAPRQLWPRLAGLWIAKEPWWAKVGQLHFLVMHTAANAFRVGQGARLLDSLLAQARGLPLAGASQVKDRGYVVTESIAAADMREQARLFAEEPDRPKNLLLYKWGASRVAAETGGFPMAAFDAVDARVRAAGIEPIYVVMPSYYSGFYGRDAAAEIAKRATVYDLDRPELVPELFDRTLWFDPGHFNARGAEVFTADLAARIAATPAWRRTAQAAPPVPKGLQVQLAWQAGGDRVLQCDVQGLRALGEVVLSLDVVTVQTTLENGLTASLPIPPAAVQSLERLGAGRARGTFVAAELLARHPEAATLHAQVALLWDGKVVAVSDALRIDVRR